MARGRGRRGARSQTDAERQHDMLVDQEKRRAKRDTYEKVAAILVALSWTQVIHQAVEAWWLQVLLCPCVYFLFWLVVRKFWMVVDKKKLEHFTLLAAELTAFVCRDGSKEIFKLFVPGLGEDEEHEKDEGHGGEPTAGDHPNVTHVVFRGASRVAVRILQEVTENKTEEPTEEETLHADFGLCGGYVLWAAALLLLGIVWLSVSQRLRKETEEEVVEVMQDIDLDMWGLTIGWTLMAAMCAALAGKEWEELVEEGTDRSLRWLLIPGILVPIVGGGILLLMEMAGLAPGSAPFQVSMQSIGFMIGFILNASYGVVFLNWWDGEVFGHVTLGSILYPVIITGFMAIRIGKKRVAAMEGAQPESWKMKVEILGAQILAGLAWEGLFDKFFHSLPDNLSNELAAILEAITLTVVWGVVCFAISSFESKEEESEDVALAGVQAGP